MSQRHVAGNFSHQAFKHDPFITVLFISRIFRLGNEPSIVNSDQKFYT